MPTFQTQPLNQQTNQADEYGPQQEQPEYSEQVEIQENSFNDIDFEIFSKSYALCMEYNERNNVATRSPQPEQQYHQAADNFTPYNSRCSTPVGQIAKYDQENTPPILRNHKKKVRPALPDIVISNAKQHMKFFSNATAKAEGYLPKDTSEGFASSVASSRSSSPIRQR